MSKTNEVRLIDANALLNKLQVLLNQSVFGNTVSNVGKGIEIAMQRVIEAKEATLNDLRDAIYEDAVAHGLWEDCHSAMDCASLIFSEVSELESSAEYVYQDGYCDYQEYAEELADVIIMSLSVAGKLGIDIDAAVKRKMAINKGRPWKHGKE